jgi:hypothetical protein
VVVWRVALISSANHIQIGNRTLISYKFFAPYFLEEDLHQYGQAENYKKVCCS